MSLPKNTGTPISDALRDILQAMMWRRVHTLSCKYKSMKHWKAVCHDIHAVASRLRRREIVLPLVLEAFFSQVDSIAQFDDRTYEEVAYGTRETQAALAYIRSL